jgi:hypothetical protein
MPRPFVLSLPEADPALREAIARALGDAAEVHEPPPSYGVEEVKLILDLVVDGTAIVGALVTLRNWYRSRPKPKRLRIKVLGGGTDIELVSATDDELKKLAEESRRDG